MARSPVTDRPSPAGGASPPGPAPDTAAPDTTAPGAAAPDTAAPGAAAPDTAGPDSAGPDTAGPDSAGPDSADDGPGLRIGDAAARAGVSARTLRYYDELGLLSPSQYTAGGERRYRHGDLEQLRRILELREALGMNLEEIKEFLDSEHRLDEVRAAYRAERHRDTAEARAQRRALLEEALSLNQALEEQLRGKLTRMEAFRATLAANAARCRELLDELG